jgi:FkbM family methyltransferase
LSFVSFAQNFEDVMLWRALSHVDGGFYIDIGAWSPEQDSVTKAFYDRGWNGINVEPNPDLHAELQAARPRDVNLQIAVADSEESVELFVVRSSTGLATGLSTLDKTVAADHVANGFVLGEPLAVATRTLASICRDHVPAGTDIHFLKIDVEGAENVVIRGADWTRHRPWIVIVEATRPNSHIETHITWEPMLVEAGYTLAYRDGLNRFYVVRERADLAAAFAYPPNFFDGFVSAGQHRSEARAAALVSQLDVANATIDGLTNTVQTMQANWSWRLTRPFRLVARSADRARNTIGISIRRAIDILAVWQRPAALTPRARQIHQALKAAITRRRTV